MISLKVLSTAAAMALVLPMAAPTASFAQDPHAGRAAVRGVASRQRWWRRAPAARFSGGGGGGGGGFRSVAVAGGAPVAQFRGGGGGYRGWNGGYRRAAVAAASSPARLPVP